MEVAMRDAYAEALVELGRSHPGVVVLDADVSKSTRSVLFAQEFPERFFNLGVAEQNMLGVAAGLSLRGLIPFVNTFAFLAAFRAAEQVRTSISYPRLNVKIVGHYGGLSDSFDGPTHQAIADLAVMRALPHLTVVVPADAGEARQAVRVLAEHPGPVYLRLCRNACPAVLPETEPFQLGQHRVLRPGNDVTLVAMGIMVSMALEAADRLRGEGMEAEVIHVSTLKPLAAELLVESARRTRRIVTCEEHTVYGGLYSAVAEVLAAAGLPAVVRPVAIRDRYAESGPYPDLLTQSGLSPAHIVQAVRALDSGSSPFFWTPTG